MKKFVYVTAFIVLVWMVPAFSSLSYRAVDLGTLGGSSSRALCINDYGQVVGWALNDAGQQKATIFDATGNGQNRDLGAISQLYEPYPGYARAINNRGEIVGSIYGWASFAPMPGSGYVERAVRFDPSGNVSLGGVSGSPDYFSRACSINDSGQIVGYSSYGFVEKAVKYGSSSGSANIRLDHGTAPETRAFSINDRGQIAGYIFNPMTYRAVLFDSSGIDGNIVYLGASGEVGSEAYCINNRDEVVGWTYGSGGYDNACLFDSSGQGRNVNLGTLASDTSSQANCISDSGKIVGWSGDGGSDMTATWFDPSGNGGNVDLNTTIDPALGWRLTEATWINDIGQIVGYGRINNETHAFLLNPVHMPEPATAGLLILGGWAIRGRRRS
jgi:uncharacterized membrane protein